jgi:hypothetical protein
VEEEYSLVELLLHTVSHCDRKVFAYRGESEMYMGISGVIHLGDVHVQAVPLLVEGLKVAYMCKLGWRSGIIHDLGATVRDASVRIGLSGTLA